MREIEKAIQIMVEEIQRAKEIRDEQRAKSERRKWDDYISGIRFAIKVLLKRASNPK